MFEVLGISLFQWGGLIFGLLFIYTSSKSLQQSWIYSLISAVCIGVEDFWFISLFLDGILQIFYVLIAFLGIYIWISGPSKDSKHRIGRLRLSTHLFYLFFMVILTVAAGHLFESSTAAVLPYVSAATTVLSIFSTFLIIYNILDAWAYRILANVLLIYVYYVAGASLFSILFIIYLATSFAGLRKWMAHFQSQ